MQLKYTVLLLQGNQSGLSADAVSEEEDDGEEQTAPVLKPPTVVSAVVEEQNKPYCCCKGQDASLYMPEANLRCEQSWAKGTASIAHFKDGKGECVLPCTEVSHGNLTLGGCDASSNVTLTSVCSDENAVQMEKRINFYPEECPDSDSVVIPEAGRSHYGAAIPPIVLSLLILLLIIHWKCHEKKAEDGLPV